MKIPFYELALLGRVGDEAAQKIQNELELRVGELGFTLGKEVTLFIGSPAEFEPSGERCAAALCFALENGEEHGVKKLMERGVAVIPVALGNGKFADEFPMPVAELNGLQLGVAGPSGVVLALLECASLLPRQRRVFISYRRDESTEAALQLYAALSSRLYDVFLDTHDIHPGEHFQEVLWQRLCDCDVMLFLDTPQYFNSRWTEAEFGRATYRGIPFVRAAWPEVPLNERAQLAAPVDLTAADFSQPPGHLTDDAIRRICDAVEDARTRGVASRYEQLMATVRHSVTRARGSLEGISLRRSFIVKTPKGKSIAIYPSLGVPTSYTLHAATRDNHPPPVAVVYDDVGIEERDWQTHMDWISEHLRNVVRLVKGYRAGWDFADWN
ncbi:toll/interleukin-1 receptor domain-containing protein [Burkholderia cenocepacia]|uniref:toll/interleukin-1 receptor domain-containing protein n=1 Tax=Burkholderia cenocepacia TaxID=95486 RepID=UPI002653889D|nr:toll/interleukin-1 receptor domain-containing protein [Burkholderia cenocepacia]MDN7631633.1 toll/interleukin-1 receptor domain-containing protein [Burkholderia cenocepacia]